MTHTQTALEATVLQSPPFLTGWGKFSEMQGSIRALIMGRLVKLSKTTVASYDSDYYHDAMWLAENINDAAAEQAINGGYVFHFSFDNCGTWLSTDPLLGLAREAKYTCRLYATGGEFGNWAWNLAIVAAS